MTVVSYGCETWSLTLREEYWLWLFKNRLRPKWDDVNRGLQENAKCRASWFVLRTKYYSDGQNKKNEMGRARGIHGREKKRKSGSTLEI